MENINIEVAKEKEYSNSSKDKGRKELLWEPPEEELIMKWRNEMVNESKKHISKGKYYKRFYILIGIPIIILPLVGSSFSELFKQYPYAEGSIMLLVGILSGIMTFFNFGKRYTLHYTYEHKYKELVYEIDLELHKPRKHRLDCDVFMERYKCKYASLNETAPKV